MPPSLSDYRLFLLDLDDTLYLERDYVLSGLRAVAKPLSQGMVPENEVLAWLKQRFLTVGRESIFDVCLDYFNLPRSPEFIRSLVNIYREHEPIIDLLPGADELLKRLSEIGNVVIVTDGLPSMQAKKCRALGLIGRVDRIVYCWAENAPKPSPAAIMPVLSTFQGTPVFIGDNPRHDMCMASQAAIPAIRVRQGRFRHLGTGHYSTILEVDAVGDLLGFI